MTYTRNAKIGLATIAFMTIGGAASAATLATFDASGSIAIYQTGSALEANASGVFDAEYFEDVLAGVDSSTELLFTADLNIGSMSWSEALSANIVEIESFIGSVLSSSTGDDVLAMIDSLLGLGGEFDGEITDGGASLSGFSDTSVEGNFFVDYEDDTGPFGDGFSYDNDFSLSLSVDTISAVPLPATAPLLLAGVGALALRRKRKAA
ncbi:VPLPA-CTERM sorting domain-containing protein [Aliiroseovarius sp. PTFE2010]|uniref:VPLPA-CTERM sorting domain-containing protein n=1 Tax=Aliiroseovarius sp. PTFE2010 TaxID=3417190 RepID=UPI003CF5961B